MRRIEGTGVASVLTCGTALLFARPITPAPGWNHHEPAVHWQRTRLLLAAKSALVERR
jgi:hypothetical protein